MMGQQETVAEQAGGALRRIVLTLTVGVFMAAIIIASTLPALALTEYRAKSKMRGTRLLAGELRVRGPR